MIIKSFRKEGSDGYCGQDIGSWTDTWNKIGDISKSADNVRRDSLSLYFKKYFPLPPARILEGGCGTGRYVIAYRKMGYEISGVDFSGETIRRIKEQIDPSLPLYEADVRTLPFENGYFDCYYTGGVFEHFEEGPDLLLKEARRVLKKGGIHLVSVPYVNLLRRCRFSIASSRNENDFFMKRCPDSRYESHPIKGYRFCEYYFDKKAFTSHLEANGFLVEKAYPIDFVWGEFGPLIHKFISNFKAHKSKKFDEDDGAGKIDADYKESQSFIEKMAYDFIITENKNNIFFYLPLTVLNYLSGNMILFVARAI